MLPKGFGPRPAAWRPGGDAWEDALDILSEFDHPGTELFNDIARSDDEALRWEVVGRGASFATDFDYRS